LARGKVPGGEASFLFLAQAAQAPGLAQSMSLEGWPSQTAGIYPGNKTYSLDALPGVVVK